MSTGAQPPSARLCFFTGGLFYFESNSCCFYDALIRPRTYREQTCTSHWLSLASPSRRCLENTPDSDPQLGLIHPKHAKPSRDHLEIGGRRCPDSSSGCCHNSLRMSRFTASFSIRPQLSLTLCIPSLTSRSPGYHCGYLNWVIGIVVATRGVSKRPMQENCIYPITTSHA